MNRTKLKNYAPQARRDFIQAMTDRAAFYGLTSKKIEPVVERGDVAVIAGREHPRDVARKRKQLEDRISRYGFGPTMEALAYTWFNRLVAIRFMELHGYLDHGYRVLSNPEGKPTPEILEHAEHVELPGLKLATAIDLKLAGNKEAQLYRLLLMAQCNALHDAMPFLFEKIDDETELLLPDNLLNSDSLIRKLVEGIDEEDWQEIEVIGWLYEAYVSERYEAVIGSVVASADIPAATQRFTPKWIVRYLVQNTLGRHWLATYPQSSLSHPEQMSYYIEPAEQTLEVQEQLKAITPTNLNPEELTLLDPACGSGHILVEAYDLFKAIYLERGYRARDIPALILQRNLFGLEIDDRAAQLAAFALMMKARADDRRIFDSQVKPNILAFQDSQGMNPADITHALNSPISRDESPPSEFLFDEIENEGTPLFSKKTQGEKGHVSQGDIACLLVLFENAKTFGSLIQIPPKLATKLTEIEQRLNATLKQGNLTNVPAHVLKPLLQQARLLSRRYDAVVANPPYMGSKFYSPTLKEFVNKSYKDAKTDLCVAFVERAFELVKPEGFVGEITMQSWMFLSSFETFRVKLIEGRCIRTMTHLGPHAFPSIGGQVVQVTAFVATPKAIPEYRGSYKRLVEGQSQEKDERFTSTPNFTPNNAGFACVPGSPVAYWVSDGIKGTFTASRPLCEVATPLQGMTTSDTSRFVRYWHEVDYSKIGFGLSSDAAINSKKKWFPFNKGGDFRKWYGNSEFVVNYQNDGQEMKAFHEELNKIRPGGRIKNTGYYFRPCVSWSKITARGASFRFFPQGYIFADAGSSVFSNGKDDLHLLCGLLNSPVTRSVMAAVSPTVNYEVEHISVVPVHKNLACESSLVMSISEKVNRIIDSARLDWDSFETSWDFQALPVIRHKSTKLQTSQRASDTEYLQRFRQVQECEAETNRLLIEIYSLEDELSPEVHDDQTTLYRSDQSEDAKRLLSYAICCIMGRYSLDKPGLIYAHSGNEGFDPSQYTTFRADDDGIVPLLETDWGIRDDATNRIAEFISVAWPKEHVEENLKFVADSLGPGSNEKPRDTIRRYLAAGFYKHHLASYKRRPIYWLFSSGKQRAFQCLVYLHRYNEGTLARMRNEYVIPLQGQIAGRIEQLEGDKLKATSTSHRKKLQKEQDDLKKQQAELHTFEEKLKHAADQKISLDLDDGVKVNYGKFGDLLAEAKAITGGRDED